MNNGDWPFSIDPGPPWETTSTTAQFASASAISYATAPNADAYWAMMRLFYENRQEYGPHLSPGDVADRLRARYGIERDIDQLDLDLKQLMQWRGARRPPGQPARSHGC